MKGATKRTPKLAKARPGVDGFFGSPEAHAAEMMRRLRTFIGEDATADEVAATAVFCRRVAGELTKIAGERRVTAER